MTNYKFQSELTLILKRLRVSKSVKEKSGWSKETGAGFILEDIHDITLNEDNIHIVGRDFLILYNGLTKDLNLRETIEAIRWIESQPYHKVIGKRWSEW